MEIIIPAKEVEEKLFKLFCKYGVNEENAKIVASTHMKNSLDGIPSHGLNRVARIIGYIKEGLVDSNAEAEIVEENGASCILDGKLGLGVINAVKAMDLACDLAEKYSIGIVTVKNTNHWLRGGTYGWQAANRGFAAICWGNSTGNTVPWGGSESVLGNNPLVMAVPRSNGQHVVSDSAMSQFSFGGLQNAVLAGKKLPFVGGWDENGDLTDDPAEITKTRKLMSMGYWKGSGMSILLDLIGTLASGGNTVSEVTANYSQESGLTQVMIAIKPTLIGALADEKIDRVLDDVLNSGENVRYPGQREYREGKENAKKGVPVDDEIWAEIMSLF